MNSCFCSQHKQTMSKQHTTLTMIKIHHLRIRINAMFRLYLTYLDFRQTFLMWGSRSSSDIDKRSSVSKKGLRVVKLGETRDLTD